MTWKDKYRTTSRPKSQAKGEWIKWQIDNELIRRSNFDGRSKAHHAEVILREMSSESVRIRQKRTEKISIRTAGCSWIRWPTPSVDFQKYDGTLHYGKIYLKRQYLKKKK